tara:strand:- start:147 stop:359 length:213 start_codon:yes stop_codon:yes gene_type:complete
MKIGDLVRYKNVWRRIDGNLVTKKCTGIIIETGIYAGNKDLKVMWGRLGFDTERSDVLEVVSESRRSCEA